MIRGYSSYCRMLKKYHFILRKQLIFWCLNKYVASYIKLILNDHSCLQEYRENIPNNIYESSKTIFCLKNIIKMFDSFPILILLISDQYFFFRYTESLCHVNAAPLSFSLYKYCFYFYTSISTESLRSVFPIYSTCFWPSSHPVP